MYKTFRGGPKAGELTSNADLYRRLFQACIDKAIQLDIRWMPAHLQPNSARPSGVSDLDIKGNNHADVQAGVIAREMQVPLDVASDILYYHRLTAKIQRRLATIITSLPPRSKSLKKIKSTPVKDKLEDLMYQSSHMAVRTNNTIRCARCHNSFKCSDSSVVPFLKGSCSGLGSASDRPVALPLEAIHVGNKVAHHSHKLRIFRGLLFCGTCGCRGPTKLQGLAARCSPPTSYGKQTLAKLSKGHLPPNLGEWPQTAT